MHGYTSGKTDMGGLRLLFTKYNLFLFDFRAHGEDIEGQASTFGYDEVYDVFAAVDFLRTRAGTKELPLIGYGFSMGAATAIEAQARDPKLFDALILDCPFDSSDNIIKRGLDRVLGRVQIPFVGWEFEVPGRALLQKYAFHPNVQPLVFFLLRVFAGMDVTRVPTAPKPIRPIESVKLITVPVLFIACYADDRVPVDAVVGIYANAPGYKRLWVTKGVRHYGSVFNNPELYQHFVTNFIDRVLSKKYESEPHERVTVEMPRSELLRMHERLYTHPFPPRLLALLYHPKVIAAQ
jgi:pimeloyl-ACP methyl ester carboxylesterase